LTKILCPLIILSFNVSSIFASEYPRQKSFFVMDGSCCGGEESDPHAVHGTETETGAFILSGKIIDQSGMEDGFVLKIPNALPDEQIFLHDEGDFNFDWSIKIGALKRRDGINAAVAFQGAVFAGGYLENQRGIIDSVIVKLDQRTGNLIWASSFPSKNENKESAIESVIRSLDNGLIITGVKNSRKGTIEGFKSYGNPQSGDAFVMYFSEKQIKSEISPKQPYWEIVFKGALSGKHIVELTNDNGYILVAHNDREPTEAKVLKISSNGELVWKLDVPNHGEATAIVSTKEGYFLSGHKFDSYGGIDASISKISLDGEFIWNKTYGNPDGGEGIFTGLDGGNPKLVYDECWGITQFKNGLVLACGTGIEHCEDLSINLRQICEGDPRTTWRSYLIKIDFNGNLVWQRASSFLFGEDEVASTASEWVFTTQSGNLASVVDLSFGVGLEILE